MDGYSYEDTPDNTDPVGNNHIRVFDGHIRPEYKHHNMGDYLFHRGFVCLFVVASIIRHMMLI